MTNEELAKHAAVQAERERADKLQAAINEIVFQYHSAKENAGALVTTGLRDYIENARRMTGYEPINYKPVVTVADESAAIRARVK